MAELTGTNDWSNINSHDNASRQVAVQNGSGNGVLNITNSQFHNGTYPTLVSNPPSTTAAQGLLYSGHGSANMTLSVQNTLSGATITVDANGATGPISFSAAPWRRATGPARSPATSSAQAAWLSPAHHARVASV